MAGSQQVLPNIVLCLHRIVHPLFNGPEPQAGKSRYGRGKKFHCGKLAGNSQSRIESWQLTIARWHLLLQGLIISGLIATVRTAQATLPLEDCQSSRQKKHEA